MSPRAWAALLLLCLLASGLPARAALLGQPDLAVSQPGLDPSPPRHGDSVVFNATVSNVGDGDAASFDVAFLVDGVEVSRVTVPALAAGASVTVTSGPWSAQDGNHTLDVVADVDDAVAESDETNNDATLAFAVAGLPDLVGDSLAIQPAAPRAGDATRLVAHLRNGGDAPAGPSHARFLVDGAPVVDVATPGLAPGQAVDVLAPWNATAGQHTLRAEADALGEVAESDETNNGVSAQVTVAPPTQKPDLVVADATWQPASPAAGDAVTLRARVANTGPGDAPASLVAFDLDGQPLGDAHVPGLAAGQSAWVDGPAWTATAGDHALRLTADPDAAVAETDEADNTLVRTLPVANASAPALPDLRIAAMSIEPSNPQPGGAVQVTAQVRNEGPGDARGFRVRFEVDGVELATVAFSGLAPGEQQEARATWTARQGAKVVRAIADAADEVQESDESNNAAELTLPSLSDLPDLVVQDLGLTQAPTTGGSTQLRAVIANDGSAASPPTTVAFALDGNDLRPADLPGLAPGATATVLSPGFPTPAGMHHATARPDPLGMVPELSEDNERSLDFTVGAGGTSATGLAARVVSVRVDPAPVAGRASDAVVGVRNDGSAPATGLTLRLRLDGVPAGEQAVSDLGPGAVVTLRMPFTPEAGTHTLRAELLAQDTPVGAPFDVRIHVARAGYDPLLDDIVVVGAAVLLLGLVGYRKWGAVRP